MTIFDEGKMRLLGQLSKTFTPGAPVSKRDLFAGRIEQILQVLTAVNQPGQQVVLYGERGVGKTSLANLLSEFAVVPIPHDTDDAAGVPTARINCSTNDTFKSIWIKVLKSLRIEIPEEWAHSIPDPDEIRVLLSAVKPTSFVILDEFDRWEDDEGLSLMADTLKALSDHAVETKVVIVGVADSIDGLIGEHESIQRGIEQVPMPRMSRDELLDIPLKGFERLGMTVEDGALNLIASLAEGLPHYAHYFCLYAGQRALQDDRMAVTVPDVRHAITTATQKHSVLQEYQTAISAQRRDTLFENVLLACALAAKDKLGFFTASDVKDPMSEIMGKPYLIPAFAPHLKAFTKADRGAALRREGPERRYKYRFRNPLMQPFAVLTALSEDRLPLKYQQRLYAGNL